jgi:hypothetical protein
VKITGGGRITAAKGDTATLGGNAKSSEIGETEGEEHYHDHGPAQPLNVHSLNVLAIVHERSVDARVIRPHHPWSNTASPKSGFACVRWTQGLPCVHFVFANIGMLRSVECEVRAG